MGSRNQSGNMGSRNQSAGHLQEWTDPQGMRRSHASHEDVFSAVGGLELNRDTSARDLLADTSASLSLAMLFCTCHAGVNQMHLGISFSVWRYPRQM